MAAQPPFSLPFLLNSNVSFRTETLSLIRVEMRNPHPANEYVVVKGKKISSVSLINSIGELIYTANYQEIDFTHINVQSLAKGIYYVKVQMNNSVQVKEVVIQ
jgi:hypothetical protein